MRVPPNSAIQLYSVRSLPESLPEIIRRVGAAGYDGVEFAHRFHDAEPRSVADALDDAGIEPVAVHADLSAIEAAIDGDAALLDRCRTVGCDRLIVPHLPSRQLRTRRSVRALSHRFSDVADGLAEYDIRLGFHNDRRTLRPLLPDTAGMVIDETPLPARLGEYGQRALHRLEPTEPDSIPSDTPLWNLIARTAPEDLRFELEVAEVRAAGYDPAAVFPLCADRTEMIHLRDVAPDGRLRGYKHVPHGDGIVDMERVLDAATDAGVDWVVYENELDSDPASKIDDGIALLDRLTVAQPRSEVTAAST